MGDWWANIDITFYGKKEDYEKIGNESAMLMPNHRSDIDWLVGYMIADRKGILGTAKCYMKNDVKYVPTVGWAWWFLEFCFLKRSWDKDQKTIQKSLKALSEYPLPFLVGIFAESTRMTPAKLKASQEFALSKGIEPLKHHLLPRPKGFSVTINALKDSIPAIYDIEVAFEDHEKATLMTLINGGRIKTHLYLRRIEVDNIPVDSLEDASEWCKDLFVEKDKVFDEYVTTGKFPGEVVHLPKHYWNFFITLAWNVALFFPMKLALEYIVASFSYVLFLGLILTLLMGYIMVKIMFYYADTKRGSSFGLKSTQNGGHSDMKKVQ